MAELNVTLEEFQQAQDVIRRTSETLQQARQTYGSRLDNITAAVVRVAPGVNVTVRF